MELTSEEKNVILNMRKKREEETYRRQQAIFLLETAAKFEAWLLEEGRGWTYSAFCDEFEFNSRGEMNRREAYEIIVSLINAARDH